MATFKAYVQINAVSVNHDGTPCSNCDGNDPYVRLKKQGSWPHQYLYQTQHINNVITNSVETYINKKRRLTWEWNNFNGTEGEFTTISFK